MRLNEDYKLRDVLGEKVLVAEGEKSINYSFLISVNESASMIWESLFGREFSVDDVATVLTDNYEIDSDEALRDAEALIADWRRDGLASD